MLEDNSESFLSTFNYADDYYHMLHNFRLHLYVSRKRCSKLMIMIRREWVCVNEWVDKWMRVWESSVYAPIFGVAVVLLHFSMFECLHLYH